MTSWKAKATALISLVQIQTAAHIPTSAILSTKVTTGGRIPKLQPNLDIHQETGEITGEIADHAVLSGPLNVEITVTDDKNESTKVDFCWFISDDELYLPVILGK